MKSEITDHLNAVIEANSALGAIQESRSQGKTPDSNAAEVFLQHVDSYHPVIAAVDTLITNTMLAGKDNPYDTDVVGVHAAEAVMEAQRGDTVETLAYNGLSNLLGVNLEEHEDIDDSPSLAPEAREWDEQELLVRSLITTIQSELARLFSEDEPTRVLLEARRDLVLEYRGFIHKTAKQVAARLKTSVIDQDDLFQEGVMHMLHSAEAFDVSQDVKFISYFGKGMSKKMLRHEIVAGYRGARLPDDVAGVLRRIDALNDARRRDKRPILTSDEIAEIIGWDPSLDIGFSNRRTMGHFWVAWLLRQTGSLNGGFADREDPDISSGNGYVVEDVKPIESLTLQPAETVEDLGNRNILAGDVQKLLGRLEDRERRIVVLYFGIGGGEPMASKAIAEEIGGITGTRVLQILRSALNRLRAPQYGVSPIDRFAA